jgi:outer membrane protein assembly factor BamB
MGPRFILLVMAAALGVAVPGVELGGDSPRAPSAGSDWPGFLGPAGDGASPEKGIIAPWPREGLRVVWHQPVGMGYGAPAVARGRLYLFDRHGAEARLTCRDARTGKERWRFGYPTRYEDAFGYNNGPRACPVVDGDRVYVHGVEGMLHCLRAEDGNPLWKVDTHAEFGVVPNFFGVASVPAVEGDLLLVMVGGCRPPGPDATFADLKGNGSGVVAFDKRTGRVRYKLSDELASYASPVLATVEGRRWAFVFARGGLVAFEPASGKLDFHFPWRAEDVESVNAGNPVVAGERVFLSECYGPGSVLLKVRPGGVDVLWSDAAKRPRAKSLRSHWSTPILHDGYLYGCSGRHSGEAELRCIELATGRVAWSRPRLTRTSLLMVDGHFVCLGEDGTLRLLKVNPQRYEEVSRIEVRVPGETEPLLDYPCWAAPVLSNGLLYVRSENRLVCLELIPPR